MQDLRQCVSSYWLLRQLKNRYVRDYKDRRLTAFWNDRLNRQILAISRAIMRVRALEITEKAA